jgi:hypothetical protein
MKRSYVVIACMTALVVLLSIQSASAQGKLEGVWRITEVKIGGDNAFTITTSEKHPNMLIITKKHFSFMNLTSPNRPDIPKQGATANQVLAAWTPFVAWAGTYEVEGNIFKACNTVAKDPNNMLPGNFSTSEFKLEGDTLTVIPKTNQDGPVANPMTTKYVRVE